MIRRIVLDRDALDSEEGTGEFAFPRIQFYHR